MNMHSHQQGFSLVELAFTITGLALIFSGVIILANTMQGNLKQRATVERMQAIEKALAVYAESHARLPCPASPVLQQIAPATSGNINLPVGDERVYTSAQGTAVDTEINSYCFDRDVTAAAPPWNTNYSLSHGIVPWRVLGIPEDYAKDGWGNFFTYVVSPAYAAQRTFTSGTQNVHLRSQPSIRVNTERPLIRRAQLCDTGGDIPNPRNGAAAIAVGDTDADDIELHRDDPTGTTPSHDMYPFVRDYEQTQDTDAFEKVYASEPINTPQYAGLAYALISHGDNGYGAYLGNGSTLQFNNMPPALVGDFEDINSRLPVTNTTKNEIFDQPRAKDQGNNTFDDFVMTRTIDQVVGYHGEVGCGLR